MSNENIPETLEITCAARRGFTTHFTGHQISIERETVSIVIVGGGQAFTPGQVYTVVFLPVEQIKTEEPAVNENV